MYYAPQLLHYDLFKLKGYGYEIVNFCIFVLIFIHNCFGVGKMLTSVMHLKFMHHQHNDDSSLS